MFPDDGSEMAPEARKAAKTLQSGIWIRTHQGTNNRGCGLPSAGSTEIIEGACKEVAVGNEPIEKAGDNLRPSDGHSQRRFGHTLPEPSLQDPFVQRALESATHHECLKPAEDRLIGFSGTCPGQIQIGHI